MFDRSTAASSHPTSAFLANLSAFSAIQYSFSALYLSVLSGAGRLRFSLSSLSKFFLTVQHFSSSYG